MSIFVSPNFRSEKSTNGTTSLENEVTEPSARLSG